MGGAHRHDNMMMAKMDDGNLDDADSAHETEMSTANAVDSRQESAPGEYSPPISCRSHRLQLAGAATVAALWIGVIGICVYRGLNHLATGAAHFVRVMFLWAAPAATMALGVWVRYIRKMKETWALTQCIVGGTLLCLGSLFFCADFFLLDYTAFLRDAIRQEYLMYIRWLGTTQMLLGSLLASRGLPVECSPRTAKKISRSAVVAGAMLLGWLPLIAYHLTMWTLPECPGRAVDVDPTSRPTTGANLAWEAEWGARHLLSEGGFADRHTAFPGDDITFHLSSVLQTASGHVWQRRPPADTRSLLGLFFLKKPICYFNDAPTTHPSAPCTPTDGCGWGPSYALTISSELESGQYWLQYEGGLDVSRSRSVPFFVGCGRGQTSALLYVVDLMTGTIGYNGYAGGSMP